MAGCVTASGLRQSRGADGGLLLQLVNDTAGLEAGQRALREFLEAEGVSARGLYQTELAFEELVVNVIRHGYADRGTGGHPIDVTVCVRGEEIVLTVEDEGPPFNPLQAPDPARPTAIEDARIGGLGLHLVRKTAKRMEYERMAGRNRVTTSIQRM
jgi:serine/threonine-protein kinase RsbW